MTSTSTPVRRALRPSGRLLPEDTRRHHRALLLQLLFRHGPASRADLARSSGLTKVSVSDVVGGLVAEGLLTESAAPVQGRVGKPPVLVQLAEEARQIVAVDLSADGLVSGALLNLSGDVQQRRSRPLEGRRGQDAVDLVHELVRELLDAATRPVLGVGVGTPGVVDAAGVVVDAPNLGWHGTPLAEGLRAAFQVPVFVANDANTAVLGEHTFGDAGDGGLMLVRVGTGVGAGLVLEGVLLHGHRSAAGEVGHVVIDPGGAQCACGRRGCLETVLAAPRLRERLAAGGADALAEVGTQVGVALAPVVGTLNLHELVLSGPLELLDGPLLAAVDRTIRERAMPVSGEELVVRTSALGDDVVLVGAAVLVLAGQLGVS
ncbi:MAG TPA: ROK family transcriptional regulator [Nocardioides sp.]|uniref:ROK family transcriptional regulator n=1 Tax=Nocardioides sp. TaxID=35761 RepID=UPI002E361421|nr:ROK family transcriptional regulator [Nocardioides sp.]HEX5089370.1 ROK family transcriptional regulator [Nocardioides sp.]